MRIGVDTGGTFTDVIVLHDDGHMEMHKVPSTPDDPSRAIINGISLISDASEFELIHGTTVATNALLERRGAKTALITTQGCRDVLEIARQTRDSLYSLSPVARIPLIPADLRFEVLERLDWQGNVITPLETASVDRALDECQSRGVESIAVCLLFSFLNPVHEAEIARRARERGFRVSASSEIAPEFREYERSSTVCANAFVAPVMSRYITNLENQLKHGTRLSIMQSNGGTLKASEAAEAGVRTILSGPAGGLIAAVEVAREAGYDRIMTFDMGGTSTDVALVDGQLITMRTGEVAGFPLLVPMLDIHTVGAGGGSLARIDSAGGLRVGPQSAGASPGPVAYGKGDKLCVTDANVLLGRIAQGVLLAGAIAPDEGRVRTYFDDLGAQMGLSPEQAAEGILDVVNAQMARALRHISTERGRDPQEYTLLSFGGAGGLHACALADALQMPRILIPRYPGAFSALGLVMADVRREYARSYFARLDSITSDNLIAELQPLHNRADAELAEEEIPKARRHFRPFVEARYVGQSYSLRTTYRTFARIAPDFHRLHRQTYGHNAPGQPVELVAVGVASSGRRETSRPASVKLPYSPGAPYASSRVFWNGGWHDTSLFSRESLSATQIIHGPAIVTQHDSTTWIPSHWRAVVDLHSNLILTPR